MTDSEIAEIEALAIVREDYPVLKLINDWRRLRQEVLILTHRGAADGEAEALETT